jgi:hypothetical protein
LVHGCGRATQEEEEVIMAGHVGRALGSSIRGHVWVLATLSLLATGIAGCDDSRSPTAPTTVIVDPGIVTVLDRAIQDEYRAETTYQGVVNDFGPIQPFVNVLGAEERHSASIARLYASRSLPPAANTWTLTTVPHFATVRAACAAGVQGEQANIAMYDALLATSLPADVRQVFSNIRAASLESHLPAFQRCA